MNSNNPPIWPPQAEVQLLTLGQLAQGGDWRLGLAHSRESHLFIWMTRGQGVALLEGTRRGIGTHNALFIPAGHLFSMDLGRQSYGQVLAIHSGTLPPFPETPYHVRVRDVNAQNEMTAHLEALGREQREARAHHHDAMAAYAILIALWLHRQLAATPATPAPNAAARLSDAFCQSVASDYTSGAVMADYARLLGVTPTHLTRVCKAQSGRTAASVLTERWVHAARSLLVDTDVPVKNIAKHLGFTSAAYFTRFVQQHTGCPPTELRRRG